MPEKRLANTRKVYVEAEEGQTVQPGEHVRIVIPAQPVQSSAYRITQAQIAADTHAGEP